MKNLHELEGVLRRYKSLSCLISVKGDRVFQYYKNDKVEASLQKINSCTKSVISVLIGICIDKKLIDHINQPIIDYFGEILTSNPDERKKDITLYHLLTMSAGFHWPEFGEWNYFAPMVFQRDIIGFILGRDLEKDPGLSMNYNSGCSHLLSFILQKVTGMKVSDFANEVLFKPLGISQYLWHEKNGVNLGADGLRLTAGDMLKFGEMILGKGVYKGKRIVSQEWIEDSLKPYYLTYDYIGHYGYHWWISEHVLDNGKSIKYQFALGYGGQNIIIVPDFNLVAVFTSNEYKNTMVAMNCFKNIILQKEIWSA